MDENTVGWLVYECAAVIVSVAMATIMRLKYNNQLDIEDAFLSILCGVLWPITVCAWVVYLASAALFRIVAKNNKRKGK